MLPAVKRRIRVTRNQNRRSDISHNSEPPIHPPAETLPIVTETTRGALDIIPEPMVAVPNVPTGAVDPTGPAVNVDEPEKRAAGPDPKPALPTKPADSESAPTDDTELLRGIRRGAQVWTTYVKETTDYDEDQVDGWNRSLDVTLVFAALFSAILAAFVLESVKSLQADPAEQTVETLAEISRVLRGLADGQSPIAEQPDSSTRSDVEFRPTTNAVWVNALWFFSLSLSVAVSLAAMLAKQWCYYFLSGRTGDPITRAKERQERFNGIEKWRMRGILEMLPMLMHLSLAIFSIGLVLFLWDINVAVATAVTAVVMATTCFYVGTTLLPVWVKYCPFKTPQAEYIDAIFTTVRGLIKKWGELILRSSVVNYPREIAPVWGTWIRETKIITTLRGVTSKITSVFLQPQSDPNNLDNRPSQTGLLTRVMRFLSSSHQACIPTSAPAAPLNSDNPAPEEDEEDNQPDPFVKDSLSWLITHSQDSDSIDIAIGALAIGKVYSTTSSESTILKDDLAKRIDSHLVKHFSDCFKSHKEHGVKIYLLDHKTHLSSALDYSRWMTYFAGLEFDGIVKQVLELRNTLGINLVTHLGLAYASLGEVKSLSANDSKNIAMWLTAFISCYDQDHIYFSEPIISTIIDGLTAVYLNINISARERASNLAIPPLLRTLWKVSHVDRSQLRSSIGVNLAVFALKAKLDYPFDRKNFESVAERLVTEHRNGKIPLENANYAPLIVFSLLGFLYPGNELGLDSESTHIAVNAVYETSFFGLYSSPLPPASLVSRIVSSESFRQHMHSMLVETMMPTTKFLETPLHQSSSYSIRTPAEQLLWAAIYGTSWTDQTFSSILPGICQLIHDHLHNEVTLYPEAFSATTDLLLREVRKLKSLDTSILNTEATFRPSGPSSPEQLNADISGTSSQKGATEPPLTEEGFASSTLALLMSQSTDKQCIETAVRAVIHHSSNCEVELVIQAIVWFAKMGSPVQLESTNEVQQETPGTQDAEDAEDEGSKDGGSQGRESEDEVDDEEQRTKMFSMSGYARILTSMIMHCPDTDGLTQRLKDLTNGEDKDVWLQRLGVVRRILEGLAGQEKDNHIYTFGIAGLAVWSLHAAYSLNDCDYSVQVSTKQLDVCWGLIAGYPANGLRPDAVEALVDTTVLIAASTESVLKISPDNIRLILELLSRFPPDSETHVRPALAVAVTFWGLSCEKDEDEWEFWTHKARKDYWKRYSRVKPRRSDMAALFLLGLSRALAHYSRLLLSHASIRTIAFEINRYMKMHSSTNEKKLTLEFLSKGFDVRRDVRESAKVYLQETEREAPFTKSAAESRLQLQSAITLDGGEGYIYEKPHPFSRKTRDVSI